MLNRRPPMGAETRGVDSPPPNPPGTVVPHPTAQQGHTLLPPPSPASGMRQPPLRCNPLPAAHRKQRGGGMWEGTSRTPCSIRLGGVRHPENLRGSGSVTVPPSPRRSAGRGKAAHPQTLGLPQRPPETQDIYGGGGVPTPPGPGYPNALPEHRIYGGSPFSPPGRCSPGE